MEYPVRFSVDYPDRRLNRLSTAFRIFLVIPIAIVLGTVSGGTGQWTGSNGTAAVAAGAGGLLFLGVSALLALVALSVPTRRALRTRPVEAIGIRE